MAPTFYCNYCDIHYSENYAHDSSVDNIANLFESELTEEDLTVQSFFFRNEDPRLADLPEMKEALPPTLPLPAAGAASSSLNEDGLPRSHTTHRLHHPHQHQHLRNLQQQQQQTCN
ncbi:unnamed protein product [Bemisia tabaci]|uniref:Uncharacterized protein n=1 Tax=Bemisia tabaci TaxID=7038 RepID=A0A9P0AP42_BEMTA|nr:unnamed protein product [Bemisia tabaci]